jgi:spore maturation protein CgeB
MMLIIKNEIHRIIQSFQNPLVLKTINEFYQKQIHRNVYYINDATDVIARRLLLTSLKSFCESKYG